MYGPATLGGVVRRWLPITAAVTLSTLVAGRLGAQRRPEVPRLDSARFTFVFSPADRLLARSLLADAIARDSFPGLPRPREHVLVTVAPDARRFREWIGPQAPEWGAAVTFPERHHVVMQGRRANSLAGEPRGVLRHELAHLALRESLGSLPPRWFDEGYASYAAGEWGRDEVLATNLALLIRGMPRLDELDEGFAHGETRAQQSYALSERAVAEIAGLDPARGLSLFFSYWKESGSFDQALRRAYGVTEATLEERWRTSTRRRFGALALVADVWVGALLLLLVLGPLWTIRRQRDRERLEVMRAADEALERRERDSALEALLDPPLGGPSLPGPAAPNEDQIK